MADKDQSGCAEAACRLGVSRLSSKTSKHRELLNSLTVITDNVVTSHSTEINKALKMSANDR